MRKLALDDTILLKLDKPARYIGNEINAVMKDKRKVDVRFAMCFPDVYEIGMSHILAFRFYMTCSTNMKMFGVSAFIRHGMIWTR